MMRDDAPVAGTPPRKTYPPAFLTGLERVMRMIDVLLCGDSDGPVLAEALLSALSLYGGVCFSGNGRVLELGVTPRYFLSESGFVPEIGMPAGILILRDSVVIRDGASVPDGFFCVMSSDSVCAARILRGSRATAITCGTSPRDTLSLAALEPGSAAVSLQRNLRTLDGKLLEPRDFHVTLSRPLGPQQILFTSAALLLSDIDPEHGYIL